MTLGSSAMDHDGGCHEEFQVHTTYSEYKPNACYEPIPDSLDRLCKPPTPRLNKKTSALNNTKKQVKRLDVSSNKKSITKQREITSVNSTPKSKETQKKGRLIIIGDSHVRHLKDFIKKIDANIEIIDHFRGGASMLKICNYLQENVTSRDHVFVFGGTNDVDRNNVSRLKPAMLTLLSKCTLGKITFILVPLRVHWNKEYHQNTSIVEFNKNLVNFLEEQKRCINIVDTNQILHAGHYSRDGIHLNDEGKEAISMAIVYIFLHDI